MKRVLVTGATGFLGAHVVAELLRRGQHAIAARRQDSDPWRLAQHDDLPYVPLDLCSRDSLRRALNSVKPAAVVHCGAYGVDYRQQTPLDAIVTNVTGTGMLVEAAAQAGVERFIHVGTGYEYGSKTSPISETDRLAPATLYGATKAAGALAAVETAGRWQLPLCVVRPFTMYGPGEGVQKLVPAIQIACRTNRTLALTKGEQVRDYCSSPMLPPRSWNS